MKRGFSLVELIISIFLLGIIVTFLYSSLSALQQSNKILFKEEQKLQMNDKILNILYDDIFLSNTLSLTTKEFTSLSLQTKNSIYQINMPYVTWLVTEPSHDLVRIESIYPVRKISPQNDYYFHISKVADHVENFEIYQSRKRDKVLLYLKREEQPELIYELPKPLMYNKTRTRKNQKRGEQSKTLDPKIKTK